MRLVLTVVSRNAIAEQSNPSHVGGGSALFCLLRRPNGDNLSSHLSSFTYHTDTHAKMSHQHDHEDEDATAHLDEDDIVEIHEDDDEGDVPMDEDDDDNEVGGEGYESDGDNAKYDGEIVIGGPANADEEAEWAEYQRQQGGEGGSAAVEDNSWNATSLHTAQQSIFTLSLHPNFPNPPLAVSGGEDDTGFIFSPIPAEEGRQGLNAETFSAVKLTGHTDSVVATGWSFDGEMVATGGMDGRVRVWRRVKGRKGSPAPGSGDAGEWKDWEFLTGLETGSEVQVGYIPRFRIVHAYSQPFIMA